MTAAPDDAQAGGELTMLASGDIDYMDPGAAYYQFSYMVTNAAHRSLLTWQPDDIEEPTPDLAEERPGDLRRRPDDHLHDPRRRHVQPAGRPRGDRGRRRVRDRALAAARGRQRLRQRLPRRRRRLRGGAEGGRGQPDRRRPEIEGITATDDTTLEIQLDRPTASPVIQALSLPISAPVPEEYAKEFDAENPSTYGEHVAFTGPYMVENDASGELTGYTPGKEIKMVRNPNWDREHGDCRPAYLDSIDDPGGLRRHRVGVAEDPRRRALGQRRLHAAADRDQGGRDRGRGGPADADPERRQPLRRAEHAEAAVRRHQRPQGGGRDRRPRRRCGTRAAAS